MTRKQYPELDETLYRETLENGLTVLVVPRKGFTKKLAYFVTDFGSIHTDFRLDGKEYHAPAGVAHYLEHKMFDLPGDRDVSAEFAALGASTNAFTSYDMTAYYFSCTDHFDECLRLLLEFVSTPYFTEESVEKERGIIDQEIGMNEDAPDSVVFDNLMAAMYAVHPIRQPILGTSETIREITPEVLYICHRAFYAPGNMLLCVVGDVDPESVASAAREVLGSEKKETGVKLRSWQEEMTCPKAETECSMEVAMPTFHLAFKCDPLPDDPGHCGSLGGAAFPGPGHRPAAVRREHPGTEDSGRQHGPVRHLGPGGHRGRRRTVRVPGYGAGRAYVRGALRSGAGVGEPPPGRQGDRWKRDAPHKAGRTNRRRIERCSPGRAGGTFFRQALETRRIFVYTKKRESLFCGHSFCGKSY